MFKETGSAGMEDYNFWADLLDTFQSSADWIKALWLTIPPGFVLALIWLFRRRMAPADALEGELLYTVRREPDGLIQIYRHGFLDDANPDLLVLEHQADASEDPQRLG